MGFSGKSTGVGCHWEGSLIPFSAMGLRSSGPGCRGSPHPTCSPPVFLRPRGSGSGRFSGQSRRFRPMRVQSASHGHPGAISTESLSLCLSSSRPPFPRSLHGPDTDTAGPASPSSTADAPVQSLPGGPGGGAAWGLSSGGPGPGLSLRCPRSSRGWRRA